MACGGRSESGTTSADASTPLGTTPDSGSAPFDAAPPPLDATIGSLLVDSGVDSSAASSVCDAGPLVAHAPALHRPSGSTCPGRAAGGAVPCGSNDGGAVCATDTDCTMGTNGRCVQARPLGPQIPPPPICAAPQCSYDECESDTDCPSGVPCNCRDSSSSNAPNVCATGSNCRTDSDCGPGGYCSPGGYLNATCSEAIYFCHTPADTCIDYTDCCGAAIECTFDKTLGHFACGYGCIPPP